MWPSFVAILRKEFLHIVRDRGTLAVAIVIPVFQLVLFGFIDQTWTLLPSALVTQWDSACTRVTFLRFTGSVKLGQPVPESNFVSEENNSCPHAAQAYIPASWSFQYAPVNGASVPPRLSTSNCSGVSDCCHSSSLFFIGVSSMIGL